MLFGAISYVCRCTDRILTVDVKLYGVDDGGEAGHGGEALEQGAVIARSRPIVGRPSPASDRHQAESSTAAVP